MAGVLVTLALAVAVAVALAVFGGPLVFAIVPLLIGGAVIGGSQLVQRRRQVTDMQRFRSEASARKADFTERDRRTQAEDRVG